MERTLTLARSLVSDLGADTAPPGSPLQPSEPTGSGATPTAPSTALRLDFDAATAGLAEWGIEMMRQAVSDIIRRTAPRAGFGAA